ncbi:MAG: hypothetical protein ACJA1O_003036 [Spirosomataceae bacterium]|jgi:hypothetical protein
MEQETTFCQELQNDTAIDLRDNRGKRHKMWLMLLGVTLFVKGMVVYHHYTVAWSISMMRSCAIL